MLLYHIVYMYLLYLCLNLFYDIEKKYLVAQLMSFIISVAWSFFGMKSLYF